MYLFMKLDTCLFLVGQDVEFTVPTSKGDKILNGYLKLMDLI